MKIQQYKKCSKEDSGNRDSGKRREGHEEDVVIFIYLFIVILLKFISFSRNITEMYRSFLKPQHHFSITSSTKKGVLMKVNVQLYKCRPHRGCALDCGSL